MRKAITHYRNAIVDTFAVYSVLISRWKQPWGPWVELALFMSLLTHQLKNSQGRRMSNCLLLVTMGSTSNPTTLKCQDHQRVSRVPQRRLLRTPSPPHWERSWQRQGQSQLNPLLILHIPRHSVHAQGPYLVSFLKCMQI